MQSQSQSKKIVRNNTSFSSQINTKLKELYDRYKTELENNTSDLEWAKSLTYYQYLVKELISNDIISESDYARGLLIYHTMGMGKTRLAVAVAMSCWDMYQPIILLPQYLKNNFKKTIAEFTQLLSNNKADKDFEDKAISKFQFVSMDAYNSSTQMENIGEKDIPFKAKMHKSSRSKRTDAYGNGDSRSKRTDAYGNGDSRSKRTDAYGNGDSRSGGGNFFQNGLDNKLLIIDEAHNFFRAIINSGSENSNAKKIYEMIMSAKNLKLLFLTGTPSSKDPFELVPCFNMLAGKNILPTSYDTFYKLYIDKVTGNIINKNKLSNRILGLVSHVTHDKNSVPIIDGKPGKIDKNSKNNIRDFGWFPDCKPVIVSYVEMSAPQYKQYLLARDKEESEKGRGKGKGKSLSNINTPPLSLPNSEKKTMGSYYVKSRVLSIFSAPREYKNKPIELIPNNLFNETNSPKLKLLADRIKVAKGSTLVYSQFVEGGLKPLKKYLENIGMTEFNSDDIEKYSHLIKSRKIHSKMHNTINLAIVDAPVNTYTASDALLNGGGIEGGNDDGSDDGSDDGGDNAIGNDDDMDAYNDGNGGDGFNAPYDIAYDGDASGQFFDTFIGNTSFQAGIIGGTHLIYEENTSSNNVFLEDNLMNDICDVCTENNTKMIKSHKSHKSHKGHKNGGSQKTYIIYGADLYFEHLETRLSNWEKIPYSSKEATSKEATSKNKGVTFAWGNIVSVDGAIRYDRAFFSQKAKLKNILMNSKSIISDKSKLYKTAHKFMTDGKYIPMTYDLHTMLLSPSEDVPYIVKDATSFGQKGVHIITSVEELEKYKKKLCHTSAIISEYMKNPLLWNGKKFHFRIYIGVYVSKKTNTRFVKVFTNSNYAFKIFMAKDNFVEGDYHNEDIHITGRKSTRMRHQWKLSSKDIIDDANSNFYFPEKDLPNGVSFDDINKKIEKMFHQIIEPHLEEFEEYPECDAGFEIFGADVILNNRGDPFILEVNAKIGYSEDYGEREGAKEYHQKFSHDLFDWIYDHFIKI